MGRKIAVIGLGYVGLPVAVSFGKRQQVVGYDISEERIEQLKKGTDDTKEVSTDTLKQTNIHFTSDPEPLREADFYIIAVPTPIDGVNKPNLAYLIRATEMVARYLKQNDIVVYESTVYPGATEEVCIPLLESISGLTVNKDFSVGYSPERINPADKEHTFEKVVKVVSASNDEALDIVAQVYGSVVQAGIFRAFSIKTAEAAKIIENTQRDLNVALMNELSIIFHKLGIDTKLVLEAAKTKWNFHLFTPGLVGGHCIGVDPYYLTYQAERVGYQPEVILSGRRINDSMGRYIALQVVKEMMARRRTSKETKIAILGITFKENCSDIRNSKAFDIIEELASFGIETIVHDPLADLKKTKEYYNISLVPWEAIQNVQAIIIATGHRFYREISSQEYIDKLSSHGMIFDVKGILDRTAFQNTAIDIWRL